MHQLRLSQVSKECVAESVEDELARKDHLLLLVDDRLTYPTVKVIEAGH